MELDDSARSLGVEDGRVVSRAALIMWCSSWLGVGGVVVMVLLLFGAGVEKM